MYFFYNENICKEIKALLNHSNSKKFSIFLSLRNFRAQPLGECVAGVEWWNVEPLATVTQKVGCLGEDSRARKEKSRKDTFDPS